MTKKEEFHNPLEAIFAHIAKFVAAHKRGVITCTVITLTVVVLIISAAIFIDIHNRDMYTRYDKILDTYYTDLEADPAKGKELAAKAASEFESLKSKAIVGYIRNNADYILAGFYYGAADYVKAGDLYRKFYSERQDSEFRPLAMVQAALCAEELKDYDLAYDTYSLADDEYGSTDLHGQLLYDMGRVLLLRNDSVKAREMFTKTISEAPGTEAAEFARKRLAGI